MQQTIRGHKPLCTDWDDTKLFQMSLNNVRMTLCDLQKFLKQNNYFHSNTDPKEYYSSNWEVCSGHLIFSWATYWEYDIPLKMWISKYTIRMLESADIFAHCFNVLIPVYGIIDLPIFPSISFSAPSAEQDFTVNKIPGQDFVVSN